VVSTSSDPHEAVVGLEGTVSPFRDSNTRGAGTPGADSRLDYSCSHVVPRVGARPTLRGMRDNTSPHRAASVPLHSYFLTGKPGGRSLQGTNKVLRHCRPPFARGKASILLARPALIAEHI